MQFAKRYWREIVLGMLVFANISVWFIILSHKPSDLLHVYFLDVGQGDSIFIDSPTHGRILIDGGPDRKVLTELGKILPFGDTRIDVVMESHPDADHITGLVDVLKRFDVGVFMEPGVESDNNVDDMLRAEVDAKHIPDILARRGMIINLGDGAKLLILYPNQDVTGWETNDASIVAKLVYGNESFLLTGDSPKKSEFAIMNLGKDILKSTVLKAGHHGSKNSTSLLYAETVAPEYAVISAGKDNRYGHPAPEVLEILKSVGATVLSAIERGTIQFETDGRTLELK